MPICSCIVSNIFNFTPKQIDCASKLINAYVKMSKSINKEGILNEIKKVTKAVFNKNANLIKTNNTWDDLIISDYDKN